MMLKDGQQRLRTLTAEALGRHAATQAEVERRRGGPPRPGDLFIFAATAELPVEWAVVGQASEDPRRLLAVPADTHPLAGSADVKVPASAAAGPLSLRCRFGVWRNADDFDSERRTRFLEPEHVDQAWSKWLALARGTLTSSVPEQEVDTRPEYEDWMGEVLTKAQAALSRGSRSHGEEPATLVASRPLRWESMARRVGMAASVLLLLGLAFSGGWLWQSWRQLQTSQVNPPFALLLPEEPLRGSAKTVTVPPGESVFLVLQTTDPELYPAYRVEIFEHETQSEIWSIDGLIRTGIHLSLSLPLSAGEYRLHLYGVAAGESEWVAEYALRLDSKKSGELRIPP